MRKMDWQTRRQWLDEIKVREPTPAAWVRSLWLSSRHSATTRKEPRKHALTKEFLLRLWAVQNGRCAVCGLVFDLALDKPRNPLQPSIDRVDAAKGYTEDNVRLVVLAVNMALSNWGLEAFLPVARGIVALMEAPGGE